MAEKALIDIFTQIRKILWNCLFVIFYPILTTFSLLFMGLIWFFSFLSRGLTKIGSGKESVIELKKPTWKHVVSLSHYSLQKLFVDDILFGPTYYKFRSSPELPVFEEQFFGDFVYKCFDGILLQKWNSTTYKELPDFTLVYLNGITGELIEIEQIRSFSWVAEQISNSVVKVKWFNGTVGGEVIVDRDQLKTSTHK